MVRELDEQPSSSCQLQIPLDLYRAGGVQVAGAMPVTFGVPLPQGRVCMPVGGRLVHVSGRSVAAQLAPLGTWSDGSVRWMQVDAVIPGGLPFGDWSLELGASAAAAEKLSLHQSASSYQIDTRLADFKMTRRLMTPLSQVSLDARPLLASAASRVILTDRKGRSLEAEPTSWFIETQGPIRTTISANGCFRRARGLQLRQRMSFFAGTGLVKLEVTLHNPNRAKHPGGLWDLGDAGSILFRDLSFHLTLADDADATSVDFTTRRDHASEVSQDVVIYQDSSGGENWSSRNHVNREGRVPCRFRGYRVASDCRNSQGLRAEPVVSLRGERACITVAVPEFWQQFPKAITACGRQIRVGLFPAEFDDLHELQGGERKTHTIWLQFSDAQADGSELAWVHSPIIVRPSAEYCDATGTIPKLQHGKSAALSHLDAFLEESLDGPASLQARREEVDEYGWRNYGDIFADHEQAYYEGSLPLISHYNNQFDMVYGFLVHFLRTGDSRWWQLGDALARHIVDIDLYHTDQDKAAYNGGLFWFTDHYVHAHTSTHRTYSRLNRPDEGDYGGGPSAKHNFTTGLLLHHYLTGSTDSKHAVLSLADWVIAMDDGRQTIFGIFDDHPTGLATGSGEYQGPDRAGGNSISVLLDAWTLSRNDKYLEYAETVIRRCVHPDEDVAALNLLDVENRWSYTVFLSSLAKYLDIKRELSAQDDMFDYAQAALLQYAEWMLEYELPYFDQVEKLQYPTEAWAAQELRKANVLRLATRYAQGQMRECMIQRGNNLADRAWRDLLRFETRTYARSVAIVMTEGLRDCELRECELTDSRRNSPKAEFPPQCSFVPQRIRIRRCLQRPVGAVRLAFAACNPRRWPRYRTLAATANLPFFS